MLDHFEIIITMLDHFEIITVIAKCYTSLEMYIIKIHHGISCMAIC